MRNYTKLIAGAFCALALTFATVTYAADTNTVKAASPTESWVMTLSGGGSTATTGDKNTAFGVDLSIGRTGHLLLPLEAGVRQSVGYGDSSTIASTRLYADWTLFSVQRLDVFAGVSAGATYGNTALTWTAGPEAGIRYWFTPTVAAYARAEFPFDLNEPAFKDTIPYVLGVAFKF